MHRAVSWSSSCLDAAATKSAQVRGVASLLVIECKANAQYSLAPFLYLTLHNRAVATHATA